MRERKDTVVRYRGSEVVDGGVEIGDKSTGVVIYGVRVIIEYVICIIYAVIEGIYIVYIWIVRVDDIDIAQIVDVGHII